MDITKFESLILARLKANPSSSRPLVAVMPPADLFELKSSLRDAGGSCLALGIECPQFWPWSDPAYCGIFSGVHILESRDVTVTEIREMTAAERAASLSASLTAAKAAGAEQKKLGEQIAAAREAQREATEAIRRAKDVAAEYKLAAEVERIARDQAVSKLQINTAAPTLADLQARARKLLGEAMGTVETADSDRSLEFASRFVQVAIDLARAVGVGKQLVITSPFAPNSDIHADGILSFNATPAEVSVHVLDRA